MTLTQQQLSDRKYRIGASEIGIIFGANPYCTPYELWARKTDRMEEQAVESEAIDLGNLFENPLLDLYERRHGAVQRQVEVTAPNGWPIVATLDGLRVDRSEVVEIKTVGLTYIDFDSLKRWEEGDYPDGYRWQLLTQCFCAGLTQGRLFALVAGRGVREYELEMDYESVSQAMEAAVSWWDMHIIGDTPPILQEDDAAEITRKLRPDAGRAIQLTREDEEAVARYHDLSAQRKFIDEQMEEIKNSIAVKMALCTEGLLPNGCMVTYRTGQRAGFVVAPTTTRTLRMPTVKQMIGKLK